MRTRTFTTVLVALILSIGTLPVSAGVIGSGEPSESDTQGVIGSGGDQSSGETGVIGSGNTGETDDQGVIGTGNQNANEDQGVIGSGQETYWMPRWLTHLLYGISMIP